MREITPDTKIKLSQIKRLITDKHSKDQVGTVRRWSDNKLHEKTSHGWKVVANNKEYDINEYREVKARKEEKKESAWKEGLNWCPPTSPRGISRRPSRLCARAWKTA